MAQDIKGITVEIGGDTTKLGKALDDVNKKTRDVDNELRQIDRLLKLDPGNTVLLAQKQELLAKKVEASREKLDKLHEVQEQVERQFADGEIDEGAYRAFQRDVEKAEISLRNAEAEMKDGERAADDLGDEIKEAGDKSKDGSGKVQKFGDTLKKALTVTALLAVVKKVSDGIKSLISDSGKYADEIKTLSTNTHMSTDELQAYSYAAEQIDVDVGTLTGSMAKNIKSMSSAAKGTKAMKEAYATLGVSVTDAHGNLRDGQTVYWEAIDALGKIEDETQRDALSMQIFGKSAQDLNSLIAVGSEGVKKYAQEAKDMGTVLSDTALHDLGKMQDSMDRLKAAGAGWKNQIAAKLAPTLTKVFDSVTKKGSTLIPKITRFVGKVVTFTEKLGKKVQKPISDIIKAGKPIVKSISQTLKPIVEKVIDTTVNGLKTAAPLMRGAWTILKPIVQLIGKIVEFTAWIGENVAGAFGLFAEQLFPVDEKLEALNTSIDENKELWDELGESAAESLSGSLSEVSSLERAQDRLGELFDSSGKLVGSEREALRLIGQLKQAGIDIDYNPVTKQIEGYKDLQKEIANTIAQKRLSAYVDATADAYSEAVLNQPKLIQDQADALYEYNSAVAQYGKDSSQAAKALKRYEDAAKTATKASETLATVDTAQGLASAGDFEGAVQVYKDYYKDMAQITEDGEDDLVTRRDDALNQTMNLIQLYGKYAAEGNKEMMRAVLAQIETSADAAAELGVAIPENLAEGIENGSITPQQAVASLMGKIEAKGEETIADSDLGFEWDRKVGEGIEDNCVVVFGAAEAAGQSAAEGYKTGDKSAKTAGTGSASAYASGVSSEDSKGKARAGGRAVANAAVSGADDKEIRRKMTTSGANLGAGFAAGLSGKVKDVVAKAVEMASKAAKAVKKTTKENSPSKVTREMGEYFTEGFAIGITRKVRDVQTASARMAQAAATPIASTTSTSFTVHNTNNFSGVHQRDADNLIDRVNRQLGGLYARRA